MKRNFFLSVTALMLLLFSSILTNGFAQSKADAITMLDGQKKLGKVVSIQANTIRFKHAGEDLEYELPKAEVNQIQFATGRVEVINEPSRFAASQTSQRTQPASNPADRKNKIAVLPFQFVTNELGMQSGQTSQMSKQLQADCATSLRKNTSNVIVQDPLTTNRLLAKNKIDMDDAATVDPEAIAVALGVEYVVFGAMNVINQGTISSGGAVTTYKDKEKQSKDKNSKDSKTSGTAVTGNSAVTSTNYDTKVELTIYTDQGNTYYSKSKNAFGNGLDSYSATMDYLIKRTPFGAKSR